MLKLLYFCLIAVMVSSCVLPQQAASPTKSSPSGVAFTVNGSEVTIAELVKSPILRQGFEQILLLQGIKSMVAVQGITLDEDLLAERVNDAEAQATEQGRSFDAMLEEMGTNRADFEENLRINILWEALLEANLDYTDEDLRALWEASPDRFKNMHSREHSLTDNEKEALTFEDVYDVVFEVFKNDQFGLISQNLQQEIVDNTILTLTCLADLDERKFFEDMIVNNRKTAYTPPDAPEADADVSADDAEEAKADAGGSISISGEGKGTDDPAEDAGSNPCADSEDDGNGEGAKADGDAAH